MAQVISELVQFYFNGAVAQFHNERPTSAQVLNWISSSDKVDKTPSRPKAARLAHCSELA
jgi:hypothetical protein